MTQASRAVLADPRVAAGFNPEWKEIVYPIVTVRSGGSKLWDVDGNIYIDLLNGFGPTAFGHAPDFVPEAFIAQIDNAHCFVAYAARHGAVQPEAEAYWLRQFAQPPEPLALPLDHPRPALKSFRGDTLRGTIEASLYERVKQAAARNGCTLFAVLLTAYQLLLVRLSGQTDIVAGILTAGQSLHGGGPLVGHCVNFLPLRGEFPGGITFLEAARKTQQLLLDAADHQRYTFGSIVGALDMPREINRLPLIEAQFNLERIGQNLPFQDLAVSADANPKRFVNFDLFFNVVAKDHGLIIDCDYSTDLFESSTIARWIRCRNGPAFASIANVGGCPSE